MADIVQVLVLLAEIVSGPVQVPAMATKKGIGMPSAQKVPQ